MKKRTNISLFMMGLLLTLLFMAGKPGKVYAQTSPADEKEQTNINGEACASDRIIVTYKEGVTKTEAGEMLEEEDLEEASSKTISDHMAALTLPENVTVEEALYALGDREEIEGVSPDYINTFDSYTNDPEIAGANYEKNKDKYHYIFQLGLAGSGITAWDYAKGTGVKVAVIDTGANVNHKDLAANVKGCYNAVTGQTGKVSVEDTNGHGSMTAGILAAVGNNGFLAAGAAPNVDLYVIKASKVKNGETVSSTADIIKGMTWAIAQGCKIISISSGSSTYDQPYHKAIQDAYNQGVLVVCSGGNTNTSAYHYPAAYEETVGVSAVKYSAASGYTSANGTYNDQIDIAAPGAYGISRSNNTSLSGGGSSTSAAAPYVAGVAALLYQLNPNLTAKQCKEILTSTATDAGTAGYDTKYGYGIINPLAAVQKVRHGYSSYKRSLARTTLSGDGMSTSYKKTTSSGKFTLGVSAKGTGTITWKSSNTKVAKVVEARNTYRITYVGTALPSVESKPVIQICGAGTAKITATINKSGVFSSASLSTTITVTKASSLANTVKKPKKVSIKKPKAGKKKLTAHWKKVAGAKGYQVVIAKNKTFKKGKKTALVKKAAKTSKTFKKLAKGTWYVKVRAYTTSGGRRLYGPYSNVKKIKVK